jgi:hypothetical protein
MDDPPAWLRLAGVALAVLFVPAIIVGERLYSRAERKWRHRVRRFRPKK